MKFSDLNLHPQLVEGIEKLNYAECTPIQTTTIPHVIAGKDVAGLAQTGTGKTAAFLVPLIDRVLRSMKVEPVSEPNPQRPVFNDWQSSQFILVLVPTRELAEQVFENFKKIAAGTQLKGVSVYGGTSIEAQITALNRGVQFVFATPGRLIDIYKERAIDLHQVRAIVFDEADRMFDMGFKDDMRYILKRIPRERQYLVFSATLNFDVLNTAYENGAEPIEVNISKDQAKAENVEDELYHVGSDEKPVHLISLLQKRAPQQTIIFSNFKNNVERVVQFLNKNGWPAIGISSLLTQAQRNRVMEQFKSNNEKNTLVATDLAARGLDIKGVDLVINYELPDDPENYVHRIGRTGRAGALGKAFSMVSDRDIDALQRIENYVGYKIKINYLEDTEILKDVKPFNSDNAPMMGQWGGPGASSPRSKPGGFRKPRPGGGKPFRNDRGNNRSNDRDPERQPRNFDRNNNDRNNNDKRNDRDRDRDHDRPGQNKNFKGKKRPFRPNDRNFKSDKRHERPKGPNSVQSKDRVKSSSHTSKKFEKGAPKKKIGEKVAQFIKGLFTK